MIAFSLKHFLFEMNYDLTLEFTIIMGNQPGFQVKKIHVFGKSQNGLVLRQNK